MKDGGWEGGGGKEGGGEKKESKKFSSGVKFLHSFCKNLMSTYYVPGIVLSVREYRNRKVPAVMEF